MLPSAGAINPCTFLLLQPSLQLIPGVERLGTYSLAPSRLGWSILRSISILGKSGKEFRESFSFSLPTLFVPGYFVLLKLFRVGSLET
jgi:hypothetical protein